MKVTGIIAEYNPFHNGHVHHLTQARERLGSDYVVVVMSGNYVQRGAPTIIDKYSRAEMALKCGADLVLELPSCFSTASAEYFAFGGVAILDKLGVVDNLCFCTESLDVDANEAEATIKEAASGLTDKFEKIAELLIEEPEDYQRILKEGLKEGLSHAAATARAVDEILGSDYVRVMETSNNILGVEYLKAIKRLESNIKPAPIPRMMTKHNDKVIAEGFSSASAIRNAIFNKYDMNSIASTVPQEVFDILMDKYLVSFPVFRDDFSTILGSKLIAAQKSKDLTKYFGVSEDLANRLLNLKNEYKSFNQFRELIYGRNITKATVGRALMHIALGIHADDMEKLYHKENLTAVKVLGFRKKAEPLLSEIKKKGTINMVTKLSDYVPDTDGDGVDMIVQTTKHDMLYRMICMNKFDVELKTPFEQEIIIV